MLDSGLVDTPAELEERLVLSASSLGASQSEPMESDGFADVAAAAVPDEARGRVEVGSVKPPGTLLPLLLPVPEPVAEPADAPLLPTDVADQTVDDPPEAAGAGAGLAAAEATPVSTPPRVT
jgi:hypothetical protein